MLIILVAILGFVTIGALGLVLVGGGSSADKGLKRVQTLSGQGEAKRAKAKPSQGDKAETRRKQIMVQLKEVERRDRKARVTIAAKLRQAGLAMDIKTFWMVSAGVGVGIALMLMVLHQKPLVILGVGFVGGFGLPQWVVGFLAGRRVKKFTTEFANAVDVIVRGIKSGLPVNDCFKIIGREFAAPLGPEFQRLVENVAMGLTLEQALEKMYERMPTPEVRFFAIVLGIQAKTGGNLAEALGNLSTVLRSRKQMREKIKALSSEATASALIIGSLPPGVMIIVSITTPSYMALMFTDPRGHLMLLGGAMWMATGIFVMKKMIAFKI